LSEFVREAVADKLDRIRRDRLGDQLNRYCEQGYGAEDGELITGQAFEGSSRHAKR
jgi:hypothetical protein